MIIKNKKNSTLRKVLGVLFIIFVFLASSTAIVFSSFNIATKSNLSSDFDQGISYSLKFNLVDKNNKKLYKEIPPTDPSKPNGYIIENESNILNQLSETATIIGNQLQNKGLTNVSVSSGVGSYSYVTGGNIKNIPIGYVNMNFENSPAVFGITDNEDDLFLNASKISSKIANSNRYQFEAIKSSYNHYSYSSLLPSTQRVNENLSIIANESGLSQNEPFFLVSSKENLAEKIKEYKNSEGVIDSNAVELIQKNYYYIAPFIKQKYDFDQIKDASSEQTFSDNYLNTIVSKNGDANATPPSSDGSGSAPSSPSPSTPDKKAQFQTKYTWFLWKDKPGLINYLNSLVLSSYYNIYANNITTNSILNDTYVVGTPERGINDNAIDTNLRKQINVYLDSLSSLEKNIVKFFTSSTLGSPNIINENNLIGFLYEFYNSKFNPTNNVGFPGPNSDKIIDPNNHSPSECQGWSFLETDNSDLNELLSPYLIGKFDYSNYGEFFQNPKKPTDDEIKEAENKKEPIYYTTSKFKLPNQGSDIKNFINDLSNLQYDFPLLEVSKDSDIDLLVSAIKETATFNDEIKNGTFGSIAGNIFKENSQYQARLKAIASNFSYQKIFGDMSKTIARYDKTAFYDFSIFNIFLICLSAIILLVGIIVSILYRIPGALSFIFAALTFTGSIAFFNIFGFTFSFFSFIGLLFGTVISFLTPFFVFKNFKKEILEGSSIYGAFVKTMKKYWKLSLDVHVISILVSFSFLFFGKNQIIDFGAVLTISTFLSLILSGVIFFICISIIISIFNFLSPKLFMTKNLFLKMKKFGESIGESDSFVNINNNYSNKKFSNKIQWSNFYSYIWFWLILAIVLTSFVGLILLFTMGPGYSIDFSGGYLLQIYNYDKFASISGINNFSSIPNYLGSGAYIYDNVMYVPISRIDNESIISWINNLNITDINIKSALLNSYSVTEFNSSIPLSVVSSAWACFGISIGFTACWILISINWVAVLPYIIVQCFSIILSIGWIGLSRFEVNIDSVSIIILIYLSSSIYSVGILSAIKISWDRSKPLSLNELKKLTNSIITKINSNFVYILCIFILLGLVISVVSLNKLLIVAFITLIVGMILILLSTSHILLPLWHLSIKMKNVYVKELSNSSFNKTRIKSKNYDEVDEQTVKGLNCR